MTLVCSLHVLVASEQDNKSISIIRNVVEFAENPLDIFEERCPLAADSFKELLHNAHRYSLGYVLAQVFVDNQLKPHYYDGATFNLLCSRNPSKQDPLTRGQIVDVRYFIHYPFSTVFVHLDSLHEKQLKHAVNHLKKLYQRQEQGLQKLVRAESSMSISCVDSSVPYQEQTTDQESSAAGESSTDERLSILLELQQARAIALERMLAFRHPGSIRTSPTLEPDVRYDGAPHSLAEQTDQQSRQLRTIIDTPLVVGGLRITTCDRSTVPMEVITTNSLRYDVLRVVIDCGGKEIEVDCSHMERNIVCTMNNAMRIDVVNNPPQGMSALINGRLYIASNET